MRTTRHRHLTADSKFNVKIWDAEGLWGSVLLLAKDSEDAQQKAGNYIAEMVRDGDTEADLATLRTAIIDED